MPAGTLRQMPSASGSPRATCLLVGGLLIGCVAYSMGCSGGGSEVGSASSASSAAGGSGGAGGGSSGSTAAGGGTAGQAGAGVAGMGGAGGSSGVGGSGTAGVGGSGAAGAGGGSFCQPSAPTSFDVPAGAMCASRPLTDLSACESGASIEECLSKAIVACGPKCGCSCVGLHFDDGGCVTAVDSSEPATSTHLACLLSQLSMTRFAPGAASVLLARLGACNVCLGRRGYLVKCITRSPTSVVGSAAVWLVGSR
jgi:hypothetical protein